MCLKSSKESTKYKITITPKAINKTFQKHNKKIKVGTTQ